MSGLKWFVLLVMGFSSLGLTSSPVLADRQDFCTERPNSPGIEECQVCENQCVESEECEIDNESWYECVDRCIDECLAPTSTPTPTVTPTPEPVTAPKPEKKSEPETNPKDSSLSYETTCQSGDFLVTMELTKESKPSPNVRVEFEYGGIRKMAMTDRDGKAKVIYQYSPGGRVSASPDAYPGHSKDVFIPDTCDEMVTYAPTGIMDNTPVAVMFVSGLIMFVGGVGAYAYTSKQNT